MTALRPESGFGYPRVRNQDFFNARADRGPSSGDIGHLVAADYVYDLPELKSANTLVRQAAGGWQLSCILLAATGEPLILTQASALEGSRGDYIGGQPILNDYRLTLQYLNPAAFARVPLGARSGATIRPGNIGQGAVRGPGNVRFDLSLGKNFIPREACVCRFAPMGLTLSITRTSSAW